MKVDLEQKLVDFDGDPIEATDTKQKEWTLRLACVGALGAQLDDDKNLSVDQAVTRYKLIMRLHKGGEQELSPEEATEIRNRLPKCYIVMISGQACEMLKG